MLLYYRQRYGNKISVKMNLEKGHDLIRRLNQWNKLPISKDIQNAHLIHYLHSIWMTVRHQGNLYVDPTLEKECRLGVIAW